MIDSNDISLLHRLAACETDIDGALKRFSGDETLYTSLIMRFPQDPTMHTIEDALTTQEWDAAFTAAHALKGLAGNLGFVPLFHAVGELVLHIRTGRLNDIDTSEKMVKRCYNEVITAITSFGS